MAHAGCRAGGGSFAAGCRAAGRSCPTEKPTLGSDSAPVRTCGEHTTGPGGGQLWQTDSRAFALHGICSMSGKLPLHSCGFLGSTAAPAQSQGPGSAAHPQLRPHGAQVLHRARLPQGVRLQQLPMRLARQQRVSWRAGQQRAGSHASVSYGSHPRNSAPSAPSRAAMPLGSRPPPRATALDPNTRATAAGSPSHPSRPCTAPPASPAPRPPAAARDRRAGGQTCRPRPHGRRPAARPPHPAARPPA